MSGRRGGIPGPESRTGLLRPTMSEAEFEKRQATAEGVVPADPIVAPASIGDSEPPGSKGSPAPAPAPTRTRASRAKASKPKRVQRMFAIEEELDKKLWLYAIHMNKDRSEVVNDLLRPTVTSMVLYDSRDRRSGKSVENASEPAGEGSEAA